MSPLAISIIQLTAQYGPAFVSSLITIAHAPAPTLEDWQAVFALAKNKIADVDDMPAASLPSPVMPKTV